jgi:hypothetical protein
MQSETEQEGGSGLSEWGSGGALKSRNGRQHPPGMLQAMLNAGFPTMRTVALSE